MRAADCSRWQHDPLSNPSHGYLDRLEEAQVRKVDDTQGVEQFQMIPRIEIGYLREALSYDADTGELTWRTRPLHHFANETMQEIRNRKVVGKIATHPTLDGYLRILIGSQSIQIQAHRAAWALHYGEWPRLSIDHINGDKKDNRIANLRDVSNKENAKNRRIGSNNRTGQIGVRFTQGAWAAQIGGGSQRIHIGTFRDFESAVAARKAAEKAHGYIIRDRASA